MTLIWINLRKVFKITEIFNSEGILENINYRIWPRGNTCKRHTVSTSNLGISYAFEYTGNTRYVLREFLLSHMMTIDFVTSTGYSCTIAHYFLLFDCPLSIGDQRGKYDLVVKGVLTYACISRYCSDSESDLQSKNAVCTF